MENSSGISDQLNQFDIGFKEPGEHVVGMEPDCLGHNYIRLVASFAIINEIKYFADIMKANFFVNKKKLTIFSPVYC